MSAATLTAPAPPVMWPGKCKPWPHQLEAFHRTLEHPGFMLAVGMGGGKSAIAAAVADHTDVRRMLIFCPKNVVGVWEPQLVDHSHRQWHVHHGQVNGARGPLANPSVERRASQLATDLEAAGRLGRPFCAVVNIEAAPAPAMAKVLSGVDWDLIVVDESHRIKAPGGKQSKMIGRLCRRQRAQGARILALTGTPMPHSPLDLYGQFRAIDHRVLGESYHAFQVHYGQPKVLRTTGLGDPVYFRTPGGQLVYDGVRKDRLEELTGLVGPLMFQVSQDELDKQLGLADPVDVYRTTTLEAPTRRVYRDLEKDLLAELDGGTVTSANAMVNILRLAQVANGFAVDATTGRQHQLADPPEKTRLLADVLQDLEVREPVIVFCRFHHDLDQVALVCDGQGRRYGELSGRQRDGLTAKSTMRPDIDVLAVQIQAGDVGIDLTRARYAIYFSLGFALGQYLQSRKRLHRPGQAHRVTYIHLLAEQTVDTAIYRALRHRGDVVNTVLNQIKEHQP